MTAVDDYLAKLPKPQRAELARIRKIIQELVPSAEETISYGMPAFKYDHRPLVYYAAFKNHLSIFPTSAPTKTLEKKLSGFTVSKGTIRFTIDNPPPDALIKEIVECRLTDMSQN